MKKVFALVFALLMTLALTACGGGEDAAGEQEEGQGSNQEAQTVTQVVDITSIADMPIEAVEAALGTPTISEETTFTMASGEKKAAASNAYSDGTEVLFVDDKAVRITVIPPAESKMIDGAALIGLSPEQSGVYYYDNSENYLWSDGPYTLTEAFNNGDGTISYIYVITSDEYK